MSTGNPYVHIELSLATGMVKTETHRVTVAQALELIVEALHSIKQEARSLGPQPALEAVGLVEPEPN
jgi:hypothetical protein